MKPPILRRFAALVAVVAWFALLLQYGLLIEMTWGDVGPLFGTLRYFSFFTILANLLVALVATFAVMPARSVAADFFTTARVRGAAALYIAITCGIYFFVLASTWAPRGAQLLADVLLHYVDPALYLGWWIADAGHGRLAWIDVLRWLLFPLAFLGWTLARGAWLHEYPYPFLDADALGFAAVACSALGIGALFLVAGVALVAFDRAAGRRLQR